MDRVILETYLKKGQLMYGRAAGEAGPTLAIAGCNNTRDTLSMCVAYRHTPRRKLKPFVFIYDPRFKRGGSHMMYKHIERCPTLNTYAARIQRAWRSYKASREVQ